ncbi:MAG: hypothetical protein DMG76_21595 [Acidobacteria bacterium]|nr:MAG: hypothetical protein DMG76_21595 [Acidobacteriota bacterium]
MAIYHPFAQQVSYNDLGDLYLDKRNKNHLTRQANKTAEFDVLSLVDHSHNDAAELLHDAIVRDGQADHSGDTRFLGRLIFRIWQRPVNEWQQLRHERAELRT